MAQVEFEKKKFGEKVWDYALWGTIGVIALVAIVDFVNPQISVLKKSLGLIS